MLIYVNFVVSDLHKSAQFYDEFLAEVGASRVLDRENEFIAWSKNVHDTYFAITPQTDTAEKSTGGYLIAIDRENIADVEQLFAKGLALGATLDQPLAMDERDIYSGILQDFDGHRIRVFCITA